jgi:phosphatidate cytidylyltransferase
MLRWRLLLGTLIVGLLVVLCWLDAGADVPGSWLLPVALGVALLAANEVLDIAARAGIRPLRQPVFWGIALLVTSSWLALFFDGLRRGAPWVWSCDGPVCFWSVVALLPALGLSVLLIVLGEIRRYCQPGGNMANVAMGIFVLIYVGLMVTFAAQLRLVWGVGALLSWIIVVKMGDSGAYIVGRLFGRHKMAPRLSPGKTVEGAAGALVFSCLGAWLAFHQLVPYTTPLSVDFGPPWGWIVYGLLLGAAGMMGDLAESLLKRDVGVKDSSRWLPGFGGVLDIVDSLLLSAPVAWACWVFGLVGR